MIVFHRQYDEKKNGKLKRMYELYEVEDSILFKFTLLDTNCNGEIRLNKQEFANSCIDIWVTRDSVTQKLVVFARNLLNQNPLENIQYKEPEYTRLARFVFDSTVYCHLVGDINDVLNVENIIIDETQSSSSFLSQYSPLFARLRKQCSAQTDMLRSLDLFNSIAALEHQLDLVTRVLVQNADLLQQTDELEKLKQFDQQSVLLFADDLDSGLNTKYETRQLEVQYILNR